MQNYNGNKGNFVANLQPNYMQFFDDIENASKNQTHKIIDARSSTQENLHLTPPHSYNQML